MPSVVRIKTGRAAPPAEARLELFTGLEHCDLLEADFDDQLEGELSYRRWREKRNVRLEREQ